MLHNVVQAIFLLTGITSLLASLLDWEWFFTTDNSRFAVKKFGRKGARWIYGTVGVLLIVTAIGAHIYIRNLC
ncbi:MAG: immunity 17 family protein [Bacteroidaceae bacterium]|nr:immunity 17 family protein [Bacteroidaceae bacterium]